MRKQLPEYIVNCFLAAGFDVPEVISAMDISDNPGNSIAQIEVFIARKYNGDPRFSPINPTVDFEFPPGHRVRICNFVRDIKERCKSNTESHACNRKGKHSVGKHSVEKRSQVKKPRLTCTDDSETELSITTVSNRIRRNVSAWIRKQTNPRLNNLQENVHFSIVVSHVPKDPCALTVSMRCIVCSTNVGLQKKDNSINDAPYLISNWCRHVKKCNVLLKHKKVKQSTIDSFLPKCSEYANHILSDTEYASQFLDSAPQSDSSHDISADRFLMSPNAFSFSSEQIPCASSPVQPTTVHDDPPVFSDAPPSVPKEGQSQQVHVAQLTGREGLEERDD